MAARLFQQTAAPAVATLLLGSTVLYPRVAHAETPDFARKPIYDEYEEVPTSATIPKTVTPSADSPSTDLIPSSSDDSTSTTRPARPTPTDRLAGQIRLARLFLYRQSCAAEDSVNAAAARVFDLERSLTQTVAELAPSKESGERLLPGAVYVLVAAMAGSIVTRRSNIVFRGIVPLAFGVTAGWSLLPVTMRNVSDLAWKYEERLPVVAQAHLQTRAALERTANFARVHSDLTKSFAEEKASAVRGTVEDWVKKGK